MASAARPETARDHERQAAFELLFQDLLAAERRRRVANALALIDSGELDPDGIFVLRGADSVVGAAVCLAVPGATGLIWPPRTVATLVQHSHEDSLVQHASQWLRQRGVKLAQCLLAE